MCSIILHRDAAGIFIAANRDEMKNRPWDAPAEYWPGICGGRDRLGGGSWAALNRAGVFAALLNRHGTLGPARASAAGGNCRCWRWRMTARIRPPPHWPGRMPRPIAASIW
ncbi:NRDE family protein [Acidocella sp. MX-AZ03]|uniref:NRDE family protein n=1 Tax=Acidocella sp. MX-AZ03 TaxID=2697363 RepID=UPI0022DE583F|nr:NRDE family protein [Acidocella sp. MX-AZ03]WBO60124.1 NRDE family protein [Acidocella sp. MX-AZ03]